MFYAASPMPVEILKRGMEKWGPIFVQFYGATEDGPNVTILSKNQHQVLDGSPEEQKTLSSAGFPHIGVHVRIVDQDDQDVRPGEIGELVVRSKATMQEYWHKPDDTRETVADGWVHTGDLGRYDEKGHIYIVDRKKDMIVSGNLTENRGGYAKVSLLFSPANIGKLTLRNRFVRSATYDGSAERDGRVSHNQVRLFSDLAEGGVGLIITGITYTHTLGQISAFQNSLANDDFIPGFKTLTEAVHKRGARIAVQLFHAGKERARFYKNAISPSLAYDFKGASGSCRVMNENDILDAIHSFGDAARRAEEAGFDAVQIHAAHGYLPSQFLSPLTNFRTDKWGGTLQNRLRLHQEIYREIKAKVGGAFPVLIKIGVEDGLPDGLRFEEGKEAARFLAEWGYDALEISLGLRGKGYENSEFQVKVNARDREAYFRRWSREIRSQVRVPVIMVGGLRSFGVMEEVVRGMDADFVSLSRPLIREPDIINRWKKDRNYKGKCISCNKCFEALLKSEHLRCVQEETEFNPNMQT